MDINLLQQFKNKLETMKASLIKKIKEHKTPPNFGKDIDPDEETEQSEEYGNILSIAQTYKDKLADIENALKKIKNSSPLNKKKQNSNIQQKEYGFCENCSQKISEKILAIDPESKLCQKCKKKIK